MAALIANIGIWMQNVGAAWLMVLLGASPLLVALTQAAISAPAVLFGLPGGALADILDRRHLLIVAHVWILFFAAVLLALLHQDALGPMLLLGIVFLCGIGSAVALPILQSSISDTVPRSALLSALGVNSIAYNAARAVGPAFAGVLISLGGPHAVFTGNIGLLVIALALLVFCYRPRVVVVSQHRHFGRAIVEGICYVHGARNLHGYIHRAGIFMLCTSALWSLLPLTAASIQSGQGRYSYLLASLGAGSVIGGLLLGRMSLAFRRLDSVLIASVATFAASMLIVAWSPQLILACLALLVGGVAWISFTASLNAAFQAVLPAHVRSRAIAIFLLAFQAAMAAGSIMWGLVANRIGVALTITLGAAALITCIPAVCRTSGPAST